MFRENLTRETILEQLNPVISVFENKVIPQKVELLANNSYSEKYAWMYSFEKNLKYRIQRDLGYKLGYKNERILFGAGGAISEAMSNAFVHGHKKDMFKPISIWSAVSQKGLGFSVCDLGKGFDFSNVEQSFQSGQTFYHIAGNGFSLFSQSSKVSFCYHQSGIELCILFLF